MKQYLETLWIKLKDMGYNRLSITRLFDIPITATEVMFVDTTIESNVTNLDRYTYFIVPAAVNYMVFFKIPTKNGFYFEAVTVTSSLKKLIEGKNYLTIACYYRE